MFEREATLYQFTLHMCRRVAEDIDPAQMDHVPATGMKPPRWVLGHLAIGTDFALQCLGQPMHCPPAWFSAFGPGSNPLECVVQPTKAELMAAIEQGHRRVTEAALRADPVAMERPSPLDLLKDTPLQTLGDIVSHLMSTHEAFHVSQLSTWRRAMGYPPLF